MADVACNEGIMFIHCPESVIGQCIGLWELDIGLVAGRLEDLMTSF